MSALDKLRTPPRVRRVPASKPIPLNAKCKVRKNLFGPVDHDELENDLDKEIKRISDAKKEKWGFDFSKGKPIEGSSLEWIEIDGEVTAETSQKAEAPQTPEKEPIQFNTAAFANVPGFKLLPNATAPAEPISSSPEFVKSVLNPTTIRKATEVTPSSSVQKKRLRNRTSSKVKCKPRKLTSSPGFSEDKTQPSIQSFFKKRKHVPELSTAKKIEGESPATKRPRLSDSSLRSVR